MNWGWREEVIGRQRWTTFKTHRSGDPSAKYVSTADGDMVSRPEFQRNKKKQNDECGLRPRGAWRFMSRRRPRGFLRGA